MNKVYLIRALSENHRSLALSTNGEMKRPIDFEVAVTKRCHNLAVILEKLCELDGGNDIEAGLNELLFEVYEAGRKDGS